MIWHALTAIWLISLLALLGACRSTPVLWRVDGASMMPALHDGQMVFVDTRNRDFAAGNIVLVNSPSYGRPLIHRIAWVNALNVRTRGDANDRPDAVLPRSAIIGRVLAP